MPIVIYDDRPFVDAIDFGNHKQRIEEVSTLEQLQAVIHVFNKLIGEHSHRACRLSVYHVLDPQCVQEILLQQDDYSIQQGLSYMDESRVLKMLSYLDSRGLRSTMEKVFRNMTTAREYVFRHAIKAELADREELTWFLHYTLQWYEPDAEMQLLMC